jgi:hypothetical protein
MEVNRGVVEKVRLAMLSTTTCADPLPLLVAINDSCKAS